MTKADSDSGWRNYITHGQYRRLCGSVCICNACHDNRYAEYNEFASDEKASWKKYQLAMPVNAVSVVTSKYISVICTLAVSIVGSIIFNLLPSIAFQSFNVTVWGVSAAASLIVPLLWTGICLPLTYWFGFRSAQTMGLITVIPMFYFVKYFEDGAGFSAMTSSILSYAVASGIAVIVLFIVSMIVSIIGYNRKK